jgi:hypothetical protein
VRLVIPGNAAKKGTMGKNQNRRKLRQKERDDEQSKLSSLTMPTNFGLIRIPTRHKMLPKGQFSYKMLVLLNIEPEAISLELVIEALKEDRNLIHHIPPKYRNHSDVIAIMAKDNARLAVAFRYLNHF